MPASKDPTEPIRKKAATYPGADEGASCNQSSFKVGKAAFLYLGPGTKGLGFKAMFKLEGSIPQAETLARENPERFGVGSTSWVTARFTAEKPLAKKVWEAWLKESYGLATGATSSKKKSAKKTTRKKAASNESTSKKAASKTAVRKKAASKKKASKASKAR